MNAMNLAVMTGFNFQVNLQSTRDLIMIVEKMHKKHEWKNWGGQRKNTEGTCNRSTTPVRCKIQGNR